MGSVFQRRSAGSQLMRGVGVNGLKSRSLDLTTCRNEGSDSQKRTTARRDKQGSRAATSRLWIIGSHFVDRNSEDAELLLLVSYSCSDSFLFQTAMSRAVTYGLFQGQRSREFVLFRYRKIFFTAKFA